MAAPALAAEPASRPRRSRVPQRRHLHGRRRQFTRQALAIRDGRILYVGSDAALARYIGPATVSVDLAGALPDARHRRRAHASASAGETLLKCNLNYESLTVAEFQRAHSGVSRRRRQSQEPDQWLEVVNWFQESMRPAGVKTSRATLDALKTKRPIIVVLIVRPHGARQFARARARQDHRSDAQIRPAARSGAIAREHRPACSKTPPSMCSIRSCPSRRRHRTSRPRRRR